ncbi:thioesterase domain-containing protein [Streptomyces sp. NPDC003042]
MKGAPTAPSRTRLPRRPAPAAAAPAGPARTGTHHVPVPAGTAADLHRAAAALGTPLAALLGAAHARVLATVAAEPELLTGLTDGRSTRVLHLTVAPSTWAELAATTATALRRAAPADGSRPEVVLGLTPGSDGPLGEGEALRVTFTGDGPRLGLRLRYDPHAVDSAYAERFAGHHLTALRLLADDPHAPHDPEAAQPGTPQSGTPQPGDPRTPPTEALPPAPPHPVAPQARSPQAAAARTWAPEPHALHPGPPAHAPHDPPPPTPEADAPQPGTHRATPPRVEVPQPARDWVGAPAPEAPAPVAAGPGPRGPGEVERSLLAVPGIREAAVITVKDAGIHRHLVAFFTTDAAHTVTVEQARAHLAATLPAPLVPSYLHHLGRLPRTGTGTPDANALAELAITLGHGGAGHTGPATATERRLAMLWAEVLGVPLERIGRHDDFFALGASSLAAVRVIVRLERALTLKELVAHPVLADLADLLERRHHGAPRDTAPPLLHPLLPVRAAHHTLVCLPYAGGSALNFRALAAELEAAGIAVLAAELPGHDFAAEDEALQDVTVIARRARDEILAQVTTPVLLWGHSSGAAAALETARLLQEAGRPADRVFLGAQLLPTPHALRTELADTGTATRETLLNRLRADHAYVELDAFAEARAAAVARAYRHDVNTANRHLLRIHQDPAAHWIDAPVEVVVARDDAWTAAAVPGHLAWRSVADHVTLHELEEGGHYFPGTRAAETAAVVRRTTG